MTRKAMVIGYPVQHSLSPRLHSYWLKYHGIDGEYKAVSVEPANIGTFLDRLHEGGYVGINLTVPHKEAALDYLQRCGHKIKDGCAVPVGAVNTIIVHDDGTLEGRNTDVEGFQKNLEQGGYQSLADDRTAVILGAGGAARAALYALERAYPQKKIGIANRTRDRADKLRGSMAQGGAQAAVYNWGDGDIFKKADLVINATSLGMRGQPPLMVDIKNLPLDATVTDMVYAPLETELLKEAKARGHKVIDGLGMLLYQAVPAFEAFFGKRPEVNDDVRTHILKGCA